MRYLLYQLCLLLSLCTAAPAATGDAADPTNALPAITPNANSYALSRTFLKSEDADRFEEQFYGFVVSGCTHPVPGSGMVGTLTAPCVAYPGGYRISDATASINYTTQGAASDDTCWVAVTAAASGNSGNFVRVGSSHFTVDCVSSSLPTAPTDGLVILRVTIASGSISAVSDIRRLSPVIIYAARSMFSATVLAAGDFAFSSNTGSKCLYVGDGTTAGGILVGCNADAGGGDVVGPSACSDMAIARYDGTTGKTLQCSVPAIDDTGHLYMFDGDINNVGHIKFAEPNGSNRFTWIAAEDMGDNCDNAWPATCGVSADCFKTDGSGNAYWEACVTGDVAGGAYDIAYWYAGFPTDSQIVGGFVADRAITCADDFAGSTAKFSTNFAATKTYDIKKTGTDIGDMVCTSGGSTCTFSTSGGATTLIADDYLDIVAPATVDTTATNMRVTLRCTRD